MPDEKSKPPMPPPMAQLTIMMDLTTNNVVVHGPLKEKGLCYMMLELTRDLVRDYKPSPILAPAPANFPPLNGKEGRA